jgi:hypothetical protein
VEGGVIVLEKFVQLEDTVDMGVSAFGCSEDVDRVIDIHDGRPVWIRLKHMGAVLKGSVALVIKHAGNSCD